MRLLLRFSLPMLVGNIFQQFYSMVDAMIVGRFVGVDALAAVGATGGMSFLVLGFVIGLANGFCVVVSQRFGARDEAGLRRCVAMTMLLSLIVTAVATAASFLGTEPMLRAMNTPENIFSDSAAYIGIIFLGLGASLFYNLFSGLLRAVGDSKTPLYFLCLSSALNVVLDLLFVVTFSMGVAGAAWATILSQGVSALLCLVYMLKKFPILRTGRADWAWHGPMVRRLARMGIPTALSNSVTAIGCMILQVTINGFGSTVVAAYTAASKVEQLTTQPTFTSGLAAATFTAQNAGAGKLDRVKDGVRKATVLNLIAGLAAAVVVWLFAAPITTWFVDPGETAVIAASVQFLNIEAVFILALGVLFVYRNALQGLGNAVMPLISGHAPGRRHPPLPLPGLCRRVPGKPGGLDGRSRDAGARLSGRASPPAKQRAGPRPLRPGHRPEPDVFWQKTHKQEENPEKPPFFLKENGGFPRYNRVQWKR